MDEKEKEKKNWEGDVRDGPAHQAADITFPWLADKVLPISFRFV